MNHDRLDATHRWLRPDVRSQARAPSPRFPFTPPRHVAGAPDTTGLRSDLIERPAGTPYLERFHLIQTPSLCIRFHHFLADDPADLHDHPWDSTSLLLAGRLREETFERVDTWQPGDLITRPAEQAHRLVLLDGEAWTYFVTGPLIRRWGFWSGGRWVGWRDYDGAGRYA